MNFIKLYLGEGNIQDKNKNQIKSTVNTLPEHFKKLVVSETFIEKKLEEFLQKAYVYDNRFMRETITSLLERFPKAKLSLRDHIWRLFICFDMTLTNLDSKKIKSTDKS